MNFNVNEAIGYIWETLGLVWLVGFPFTKRTLQVQQGGARYFHLFLALLGFSLLGSPYFDRGWLGERFLPDNSVLPVAGLVLTLVGVLFAIWARITLGANWSGRVTLKAEHELIVSGPYALARHPIYTGLLTASVGTGLASGKSRCVLGFVLVVLALLIKMSQEERLMMQTFPIAYVEYRRRVKALIPGVL
jgi:protein-S-isoprenylcysteine O-methyltransferase